MGVPYYNYSIVAIIPILVILVIKAPNSWVTMRVRFVSIYPVDVRVAAQLGFILGGSWIVISRVISRVTIIMTHIRGLITLLITTHEPPSRV